MTTEFATPPASKPFPVENLSRLVFKNAEEAPNDVAVLRLVPSLEQVGTQFGGQELDFGVEWVSRCRSIGIHDQMLPPDPLSSARIGIYGDLVVRARPEPSDRDQDHKPDVGLINGSK